MTSEVLERDAPTNCAACGKSLEQTRDMQRHQPQPTGDDSNRCLSRPRRYTELRCMYAIDHQCEHTAKVSGTGLHWWSDGEAA